MKMFQLLDWIVACTDKSIPKGEKGKIHRTICNKMTDFTSILRRSPKPTISSLDQTVSKALG